MKPQIEDQNLDQDKTGPTRTRYKSNKMSIIIGIIISLSSVNFGYALTSCSIINMPQIMEIYGITLSQSAASSLLIGLMPVGGVFGAAFNQVFVNYFSRKYSIFIMCAILWVGLALKMIHHPVTICAGRFVEGFAVALYLSLSPIYLKQVTAKELRARVMTIFGLGKSFGVLVAFCLQQIFIAANYTSNSYIVLLTFNGYIAILQVILYLVFVPHSPLQLVANSKLDSAKTQLLLIYNEQYIQDALRQYIEEHNISKAAYSNQKKDETQSTQQLLKYKKKAKTAFLIGIHVILIRQLIGANCVITFSNKIIANFETSISIYMPLILNIVQFVGNLISVLFITKRFGRRPLLLWGVLLMAAFSFGIAISLFQQIQILILLFMGLYMFFYGSNVLTITFSYPSEVLAPQVTMFPNILNWIALAIVTSFPPLIVAEMPDNNAYPLFLFFGAYGIFATIVIFFWMKQSKGLTYNQIVQSF